MRILSTISAIDLKIPPQDAAYALKDKSHLCFLDSSLTPNEYSIFSYITWNPKLIIKSYGHKNEFTSFAGRMSYNSYDLKNHIEKLPCRAVDDINLPLFYLAYYDRLLAYNHQDSRWYFIRNFPVLERKVEDSRDDPGTVFQEDDYIFPGTGNMGLVRKISKDIEDIKDGLKETADIKSKIIKKY